MSLLIKKIGGPLIEDWKKYNIKLHVIYRVGPNVLARL